MAGRDAHGVHCDFSSTEPKIAQGEKLEGGREADLPHDVLVALVRMQKIIGRPGLKPDYPGRALLVCFLKEMDCLFFEAQLSILVRQLERGYILLLGPAV